MDIVLEQANGSEFPTDPSQQQASQMLLSTAELLHATDMESLTAELRQLRQRRKDLVSIRRRNAYRIGEDNLRDLLQDFGMRVCTIGFAGGFTGTLDRSYQQVVDDTRRAIESAAKLGARGVVVVTGSRGLHTYNHAVRTIQDGLHDCLDDALRHRIDMLVPLNPIFGHKKDVFVARGCKPLDWIENFESHRIRGLMVMRGSKPWNRMPDCWKRCLRAGGVLRASRRCRITLGRHVISRRIVNQLTDVAIPVS